MTDEEINKAMAEAMGWRKEDGVYVWTANGIDCTCDELWDWANDLNAMHLAEKVLLKDGSDSDLYMDYLMEVVVAAPAGLSNHATACQRAKAFLRTLGLWKATDKESLTVGGATTEESSADQKEVQK